MAGKIVELLANEEDTVTVGQDLFRIEPGEGGECKHAFMSDIVLALSLTFFLLFLFSYSFFRSTKRNTKGGRNAQGRQD
jgi:pyruvate/2-oxoglutarate dehydrogenase complex dihydrolipoamide acyltransferase (E2) component